VSPAEVAAAYAAALSRVGAACARAGRDPAQVRLVAVSKTKPLELLRAAYQAGCRDFGENYAQELAQKAPAMPGDVRWHFIGHLQTNKAKLIAPHARVVHALDSTRAAEALAKARPKDGPPLEALVQVNLAREPQKAGADPDQAIPLLKEISAIEGLRAVGLMIIPPLSEDPEASRPYFAGLRALRDRARQDTGLPLPELSMGMTADAEVAIEEGATLVRIGTAIFGSR
jgi:PLP dependent protein